MPWVAAFFLSLILSSSIQFTTSTPAVRLGTQQSSRSDLVNGIDWRDEDGAFTKLDTSVEVLLIKAGNVPLRREVHDLKDNHPDQWNLYILALNAMQMAEQQEDSSYYAVAGKRVKDFV
jgi:tyrosinase